MGLLITHDDDVWDLVSRRTRSSESTSLLLKVTVMLELFMGGGFPAQMHLRRSSTFKSEMEQRFEFNQVITLSLSGRIGNSSRLRSKTLVLALEVALGSRAMMLYPPKNSRAWKGNHLFHIFLRLFDSSPRIDYFRSSVSVILPYGSILPMSGPHLLELVSAQGRRLPFSAPGWLRSVGMTFT